MKKTFVILTVLFAVSTSLHANITQTIVSFGPPGEQLGRQPQLDDKQPLAPNVGPLPREALPKPDESQDQDLSLNDPSKCPAPGNVDKLKPDAQTPNLSITPDITPVLSL